MTYDHPRYARTWEELEDALERMQFRKRGLQAQLSDVLHRLSLVEREHISLTNHLHAMSLTV